MIFKAFRSVPASTTEDAPTWDKMPIIRGTIVGWVVFSDPEAANLLKYKILHKGHQIVPASSDEWIEAFFQSNVIPENIEISEPPYYLDLYAYNDDDSYAHEYYIHAIMLPEKAITPEELRLRFESALVESLMGGG